MTPAQLAAFKVAINADLSLVVARAAGDQGAIAAYYNAPGAGSVWRPSISIGELNTAIVWGEYAAMTVGKQNAYLALIQGPIDATNANVRSGFSSLFSGLNSLVNLIAIAQRVPSRFEALFAVANVSPVFGQLVSVADVAAALDS